MHAEIDGVLGGRLPTFDDIAQLRYTEMVFAETLRMYPAAWNTPRQAIATYSVGDYTIRPGSVVLITQWVTNHDPRWYPDPFVFDPLRWTPEAKAARPKYSYFPFGAGVRQCIGDNFAWLEGILLLATLGQQWKMRLEPGFRVALQPRINLRPRYGMRMILEKRRPQAAVSGVASARVASGCPVHH